MTKKNSIELLSKVIEVVQELEQYRIIAERKIPRVHPIPLSTIERMLCRSKSLYRDMSQYFVKAKSMPKEVSLERELRRSHTKIALLIRENWRLEERIEKLQVKLLRAQNRKTVHKAPSLKTLDDSPSLFHCA